MSAVRVVKEKENKKGELCEHIVQTSYGALKVADLIGKKFGTKVLVLICNFDSLSKVY